MLTAQLQLMVVSKNDEGSQSAAIHVVRQTHRAEVDSYITLGSLKEGNYRYR